jgi:hypothetical protein
MRFVKEFASTLGLMAAIVSAIGHDQISPFDEDAPEVFLKYKPYLKVSHGCVPFPAVNADGEIR